MSKLEDIRDSIEIIDEMIDLFDEVRDLCDLTIKLENDFDGLYLKLFTLREDLINELSRCERCEYE